MASQNKDIPSYFSPCALILLLSGLAIYVKTFYYSFLFDDIQFIVLNPAIRSLHAIPDFFNTGFPLNRITTISSFALNYKIYGLSPAAYHIWNFLIHMAAVFSVWWLARLLFSREVVAGRDDEKEQGFYPWATFFVALIFCVHPVQTQAVTYITQRFSSLAALFYILSITGYVLLRLGRTWKEKVRASVLFLVAAVLAVTSKEEAVTLPLMVLVVEAVFFDGFKKSNRARNMLVAVVCLSLFFFAFGWLFKSNILSLLAATFTSESHDGDSLTFWTYFLTQGKVFLTFCRLFVWPFPQTLDYDFPMARSLFEAGVFFSFVFSAGLFVLALRLRKIMPLCAFGIIWVFVAFSANLVPRVNVIWEHKFYLMSFGFSLFFVTGLSWIIRSVKPLCIVLAIAAVYFGVAAFLRNDVWKSDLALWQDVFLHAPDKARPNVNLGDVYLRRQMYEKAAPYYERAMVLAPKDPKVLMCAATLYFHQGAYEKAASLADRVIRLAPQAMEAFHMKAKSHQALGEDLKALAIYDEAVKNARLSDLDVYAWRGSLFLKMEQDQKAFHEFSFALRLAPYNLAAATGMAQLFMARKEPQKALAFLDRAVAGNPNNAHAYLARGVYYDRQGDKEKARQDISRAYGINPFDPDVQLFFKRAGM